MIQEELEIKNIPVRECCRCIIDTTDDPELEFDENGQCNYCTYYDNIAKEHLFPLETRQQELQKLVAQIKASGKGKKYDCVIGISGGVDSTYVAYYVKKVLGLRPLAVHLDYGWNSELAVMNINHILDKLDIELYTHVVDWEEIKDLQLSFLKASVVDIELLNDFAIFSLMHNAAYKKGVKYILHGANIATEGGKLPKGWTWSKYDQLNITSIHKQFGKVKLKSYPKLSFLKRLYYTQIYNLKFTGILDYIDYNKDEVKKFLIDELGWRDYGGKHFESIFTRFYQAYILPHKFNVNKQKFHLSVLICSGQMTKIEAKNELKKEYYSENLLKEDLEYVTKKLGLTQEEFEDLMKLPQKGHDEYPSYTTKHYLWYEKLMRMMSPLSKLVKSNRG